MPGKAESEQNEILIRTMPWMLGYYKEEKQSAETIQNGWLYTGDEGSIDDQGFLTITGRVKDLFKTSKGKYVAPSPIEMKLSANKNIENVCVGTGLAQPIALVVLSNTAKIVLEDVAQSLATTLGVVNPKLETHEKIKSVVVLKQAWTIENKLLTPTMKVKRNALEKIHQDNYLSWYEKGQQVVWE